MKKIVFILLSLIFIWGCNQDKNSTIKIGAILPLTGDLGAYGKSMKNAVELAITEINDKGFIGSWQIKAVFEDTRGLPKECIASFEKLISTDKVSIVIGPMSSSEMLSVAPIAERKQVVLLSPSASSPAISDAGEFIFRIAPSDSYEGIMIATFVIEQLKLSSIGILYNNSEYGIGVVNKFTDKFTSSGGKVLISESYSESTMDYRTQLDKIKRTNPEAVYFVGYKELGKIVKQAKELGINTQYFSVSLFEDPDILMTAGVAAEGVIFPSISFDIRSDDDRATNFVASFEAKFGNKPDAFAASAYDATYIIAQAIRDGGNDAIKIKNALYSIKNFNGLLGNFGFDLNGDVILPLRLKEVKNGDFVNYDRN